MNAKCPKIKKEISDYFIWGGIAAAVNVGMFQLLLLCGINYKISNIITLIFIRFFCYFTNKLFVFRTKSESMVAMFKEMAYFFLGRILSLFVDYFGVIFLIEGFEAEEFVSKFIIAFLVVLTNYSFSKFVVFRKKDGNEEGL